MTHMNTISCYCHFHPYIKLLFLSKTFFIFSFLNSTRCLQLLQGWRQQRPNILWGGTKGRRDAKRWQMERGMMRTSVSGKQPPCSTIPSALLDKGCTCLLIVHMFRLPGRSSSGAVRGRESVLSTSGNWAFIQMIIQTAVREQINKIQVGLRSPESLDRPTPSSFLVPCTVLERCPLWDRRELVPSTCKGEQLHPKLSHYRFRNFANMLSSPHFNPRFKMLITQLL